MAELAVKKIISPAPHFDSGVATPKIMLTVVISLAPLVIYGTYLFGARALITVAVSVASCVVFESLFRKLTRQDTRAKDFSAVVSGILLALVMPPSIAVWQVILGALFAMIVAKEFFGGLGANVFNPALSGRAFMFVSFPAAMAAWTQPHDAVSAATTLASVYGTAEGGDFSYLTYFLGNRAGCIGETSILLILLAFVFLLITKTIDWRAPVAMLAVTAALSGIAGVNPIAALMTGGVFFGAVFMTTDYATAPVTKAGRLVFGAGCGLITFLIRKFGGYPEGVMFSILIMNILVPFLNNIIPHKYGFVKPQKAEVKK
ncbi:MAG: RnfABCDGE type electron transport complex subunit D [Spirochaetaceae bacterium]|jgi:electron transport complex protein RnfD|nr:RnfABCDGE type electron transport complex subunit D [Spirochaetaceae bacterium]